MDGLVREVLDVGSLFQIFPKYKSYFALLLAFVFSRSFHRVFGNLPFYYFAPVWLAVMLLTYFGVIPLELGYFLFVCVFILILWSVMDESFFGKPKYGSSVMDKLLNGKK